MSNTALKKEMENVVAAWPAPPTFELYKTANDNRRPSLVAFNRDMKIATHDMRLWRDQTLVLTNTLERLLIEADDDDARALIMMVEPLCTSFDTVLKNLTSLLDAESENYFWHAVLDALGDISKDKLGREFEQEGRKIIFGWLQTCQECKDQLMRVIWDHDPDARGGPKFDKADELIAFLEA